MTTTQRTNGKSRPRRADPGDAPTRAVLHEAALSYLARGAASESSVVKALERRIDNWSRRAVRAGVDVDRVASDSETARQLLPLVTARLAELGLVNDAAFAETRTKRMSGAGRSRRAISAHLMQKGVAAGTVRDALPADATTELGAAVVFAKKRRLGPFARVSEAPEDRDAQRALERKALGTMARAGFDFHVCERVLRMSLDDAEQRLRERHEF